MKNDIKIIFVAYDRPIYFTQCLDSIKDQVMGMDVHLILDGPKEVQLKGESSEDWNHLSEFSFGYEEDARRISECTVLFRNAFPYPDIAERIHREPANIGCDRNVVKGYMFAFEELKAEYAFFIQDDTVFSPLYMEQLKILLDFCKNDDEISIMNCCGDTRHWPKEVLDSLYCKVVHQRVFTDSLWKREAYEIVKPHLDIYLDLINSNPWPVFVKKLIEYCKGLNIDLQAAGGEDSYICHLLTLNNKLRVSTAGEYFYNVGIFGTHSHSDTHSLFHKNFYNKVAYDFYIDKNCRGFKLQKIWAMGMDWREKDEQIRANMGSL